MSRAPTPFNALKLNPIPNLPYNPERANLPISERVPLDADARRRVAAELEGALTDGFVRDSESLDLISDRLNTIALRTRARMNRVQDLDPVTENMLQGMIQGFEHDLWQLRVQKQ